MRVTRRQLHDPIEGIIKGSEVGLESFLTALEAQSKALSPVDTGLLRGSITKTVRGLKGRVYTTTRYAIYQEEGNRAANQGKGFFKPSVALLINRISTIFGRAIRAEIRRS
ncbi:MAG: HK97 gp10 family phage protein [Deltaproteobacteria bacterium]|nr:HK97 gp10 family phage protein [Deltaproteobacteria bacterium]